MCEALPPGSVCSSNGVCVNNSNLLSPDLPPSFCNCTVPGFSSICDIRFQPGLDCDCYLPAILALWSLVIVFSVLTIASSFIQVLPPILNLGLKLVMKETIKRVHLGIISACLFWLSLGVWRVSDIENTAVGYDVAITYYAVFVGSYFAIFALYVQYQFFSFNAAMLQRVMDIEIYKKILTLFSILLIGLNVLNLWGLYTPWLTDTIVEIIYICQFFTGLCYPVITIYSFGPLINNIENVIREFPEKKSQLEGIKWNLSRVRRELIVQPSLGGFIKLVFAFWPYLRRKIIYEWLITILTYIIMLLVMSLALRRKVKRVESEPKITVKSSQPLVTDLAIKT